MLRESTQKTDNQVNFLDITQGLSESTKIPNAVELIEFAEAIVSRDIRRIAKTRQILFKVLGNDATVDAAAIASVFHGFVRIADTIGIPYKTAAEGRDAPEIREATGINKFYRAQKAEGNQ